MEAKHLIVDDDYGTDYNGSVKVNGLHSGETVELDWSVIGRAFDTLLRLAPVELRSPSDWLCKLYEQRRSILNLIKAEEKILDEEVKNAAENLFEKQSD